MAHEIKFDGYRMHARLDRGQVRLLTRTGLDWTHKYPAIPEAVATLGARQAYLDGDLCGVFPDGITSFSMIQAASDAGNAAELVYFLFDLLHLDGDDVAARSLIERKARLAFVAEGPAHDLVHMLGLGRMLLGLGLSPPRRPARSRARRCGASRSARHGSATGPERGRVPAMTAAAPRLPVRSVAPRRRRARIPS